jgi:RNA polymerase sigma-70 factor, ECF subfamily
LNFANGTSESTSASLIEQAREADSGAWRRLSMVYGPLVYRWCRRAGLQDADAADVLQEVFRAVHGGLVTFEAERGGGFRGWLYGITQHKLADHFRHARPTQPLATGADELLAEWRVSDRAEGERSQEMDDLVLVLHAVLEAIRPDFDDHNWQAFERTMLHGQAPMDVAADLQLTPAAVRQAKFRVLRRLRRELDVL